jgi:hypothetical protein
MLQQKRNHVAVFGHAVDGTMERRTKVYLKLTMPKILTYPFPGASPKD